MIKTKRSKIVVLSILSITLSLTMIGCSKTDKTTVKEETTVVAPIEKEASAPVEKEAPVVETAEVVEEVVAPAVEEAAPVEETATVEEEVVAPVEMEQLDLASLGFELKDNLLYFNGTLLSANEIVDYTIEKDSAKFITSDSSSIMVNETGDIEAVFPIGLTLKVASDFTSFVISYGDIAFALPSIVNVTSNDGWYTITLAEDMYLKFNDSTMEAYADGLLLSYDMLTNSCLTEYNNEVLSTSLVKTYYVNAPKFQFSYEDGSMLNYVIGDATTFALADGEEILNTAKAEAPMVEVTDEVIVATDDADTAVVEETVKEPVEAEAETIVAVADTEKEVVSESEILVDAMNANKAPMASPYHIGVVGNYSYLYGEMFGSKQHSAFGGRLNLVVEREINKDLSIALEVGLGANKFGDQYLKNIVPMFTADYNFNIFDNDAIDTYVTLGVGSLIPVLEDGQSPYFAAKAGVGMRYHFNNNWMLKAGVNYVFNATSGSILQGVEVPVGMMYKF